MEKEKDQAKSKGNWFSKIGEKVHKLGEKVTIQGAIKEVEKDPELSKTLHSQAIAAKNLLENKHPEVKKVLEKAFGFAVLPEIGSASLVLGGDYGIGEVFVKDQVIGYCGIGKFTLGVDVGGTIFHEMIVFNDEETWKRFRAGKYSFAADAGLSLVKGGVQASKGFGPGTAAFVFNEGGMLLDLDIGLQKFVFKPTVPENKGATEEVKTENIGTENIGTENIGTENTESQNTESENGETDEKEVLNQRPPQKRSEV
jgi:hypothetical protein